MKKITIVVCIMIIVIVLQGFMIVSQGNKITKLIQWQTKQVLFDTNQNQITEKLMKINGYMK